MAGNQTPHRGLSPTWKHFLGLLGRLLLVVIAGTALGWGWLYLFYYTPFALTAFYRVTVAFVLGLSAGLSARVFLRRNTATLRWVTVALNAAAGLPFMYYGTRGLIGFWLFGGVYTRPNWDGLWQMGLTALAGWGVLLLGTKKPKGTAASSVDITPVSRQSEPGRKTRSRAADNQVIAPQRAVAAPGKKKTQPASTAAIGRAAHLAAVSTPALTTRRKLKKATSPKEPVLRVKKPRKQARQQQAAETQRPRVGRQRRAKISLVGIEEHRCPFCLEEVNPRDPAGVVTCPICHTMHHKSCWDVTGTCQVPHSQS